MRPQDIAILLKVVTLYRSDWQLKELTHALSISLSEISESLNRSRLAGLIDYNKKNVNRQSLVEFLEHGVKYVFPQEPGALVRGIPTAHSHPYMRQYFSSDMKYVWPDSTGEDMGLMIEPFFSSQSKAAKEDSLYYKLLALVDVIRVGKVREVKVAVQELKQLVLHESSK